MQYRTSPTIGGSGGRKFGAATPKEQHPDRFRSQPQRRNIIGTLSRWNSEQFVIILCDFFVRLVCVVYILYHLYLSYYLCIILLLLFSVQVFGTSGQAEQSPGCLCPPNVRIKAYKYIKLTSKQDQSKTTSTLPLQS